MPKFSPFAVLLAAALPAQDASPHDALIVKIAPSIVTVRVVAEIALPAMMGGEKHEMKQEALGTVVDKSGLILVPTGALDPGAEMSRMFGEDAEMESSITSLKVVVGNEPDELVATVVAKDDKLGFSFVKISELGERELTPLSFESAADVGIGTEIWSVRRLGEAYDFAPFVAKNAAVGRIKKPRSAWLLAEAAEPGTPVFSAKGALCGVVASIEAGGGESDGMSLVAMMRGGGPGGRSFVVSARVAANSVAQAIEAAAK
jgi:hypothetical protein